MEVCPVATDRVLVPLSESVTVRQTVAYAIQSGFESADAVEVHLVFAVPYDSTVEEGKRAVGRGERLLDRATAWAEEDADERQLSVETAIVGADEYLFGPKDFVRVFARYATDHTIDRLVLDPEYEPGSTVPMLQPLERELDLEGIVCDRAPVERSARHERLVGNLSAGRFVAVFAISLGFYLVLGDPFYWFDWVTGVAVAGIVSASLAHVTYTNAPRRIQSPLRTIRFALYIPYLVYEIVKANVAISLVILRPSMPIDPKLTRVKAHVGSGLPLLALANSITLTPGTLTVRANDQRLIVHTLIPEARTDLFEGDLERAIRFVFYGRRAVGLKSPLERGDAEIIGSDGEMEIVDHTAESPGGEHA